MSISNLAIVFGPTLFAQGAVNGSNGAPIMVDAGLQNKVRCELLFRLWACVDTSSTGRRDDLGSLYRYFH